MPRLFFAVFPDPVAVRALTGLQETLGAATGAVRLKWSRPEQLHLTLKFVGQVAEAARDVLRTCGERMRLQRPFDVSFGGLGAFPDAHRPRVLWVGVEEGAAELARLANGLEDEARRAGFAAEERPLAPHLTLARIRTRTEQLATARLLAERPVPLLARFRVRSVELVESRTNPEGAAYRILQRFALEE